MGSRSDHSGHAPTTGEADSIKSKRDFLVDCAAAVLGTMVAGALPSTAAAEPKVDASRIPPPTALPQVSPGLNGQQDPIVRMMEDVRRSLEKPIEQRRWGMLIDLRKCVGCQGCTIACIQENKLPPGVVYRPVIEEVHGRYPNVAKRFIPRPCLQCENPPCVPVCPVTATAKRADGIVGIDYDVCIGCRYCLAACPYNARTADFGEYYGTDSFGAPAEYEKTPSLEYATVWRRAGEASPIGNARKCHFCIHRISQGLLPACVLSCMGRATYFGDLADAGSLISELGAKPNVMRLREELGTEPKVLYLT